MKRNSSFLWMCIAALLTACTNSDEPGEMPKSPVVPNAGFTLSMEASNKGMAGSRAGSEAATKATDTPTASDAEIRTLTLAVFCASETGAYGKSGYKTGDMVALFTRAILKDEKATLSGQGLASDEVEVLLIANAGATLDGQLADMLAYNKGTGHKKKSDVLALTTPLANEDVADGEKGLTMTRLIPNTITLKPGNDNKIEENPGKPVEVVRTVAQVMLNSLTFKPAGNQTGTKFEATELFLANVKSLAGIGNGNVEVAYTGKNDFYLVGASAWATEDGDYKKGVAQYESFLSAPLSLEMELATIDSEGLATKGNCPLYVYPNQVGERSTATEGTPSSAKDRNYTLLVLKGNYTYTAGGEAITLTDRYYTVPVNDAAFRTSANNPGHDHIQRNTKYWVNLTIAGPGSEHPYTRPVDANLSVEVKVTNWSVVDMNESVD